jgi:simple sugar transport system substrate-binding protein
MKKIILWLVATCMVLTCFIAGCTLEQPLQNASNAPSQQSTSMTTETKDWKIAVVVKSLGVGWFDRMDVGLQDYTKQTGIETKMYGPPQADAAQQVQIIEDLISEGVDAICVVPNSVESLEPILKKAMDKGIVVISHEASTQKNCDFDIEAFDNKAYGAFLMDRLAKEMGEEGEYITTLGLLTNGSQNEWVDGGVDQQQAKYPEMKLVQNKLESHDEMKLAHDNMVEAIKKYPNLKGVQTSSAQDIAGCALAVEEAGLQGKIKLVGTSLPSISKQYLEDGTISMIGFWDPAGAGWAMCKLATLCLEGKKDQIKDGLDLGYKGYESIKMITDKLIYGNAMVGYTKEMLDEYYF